MLGVALIQSAQSPKVINMLGEEEFAGQRVRVRVHVRVRVRACVHARAHLSHV